MKIEIDIPVEIKGDKVIVDTKKIDSQISDAIFKHILSMNLTAKKPIKFEYDKVYMIKEFEIEPYEAEPYKVESLNINE